MTTIPQEAERWGRATLLLARARSLGRGRSDEPVVRGRVAAASGPGRLRLGCRRLPRPLPPGPALEKGTDDQQRHDGDDLAAQDHAVHVEGRLPANVPVPDEVGADRSGHEAGAAAASLALGIAAASRPAS